MQDGLSSYVYNVFRFKYKKNMSEADKNPYTASIKKNEEEEDDLHLTGCNALPCCDPRRAGHRFTVLIFLCFLSFGE